MDRFEQMARRGRLKFGVLFLPMYVLDIAATVLQFAMRSASALVTIGKFVFSVLFLVLILSGYRWPRYAMAVLWMIVGATGLLGVVGYGDLLGLELAIVLGAVALVYFAGGLSMLCSSDVAAFLESVVGHRAAPRAPPPTLAVAAAAVTSADTTTAATGLAPPQI